VRLNTVRKTRIIRRVRLGEDATWSRSSRPIELITATEVPGARRRRRSDDQNPGDRFGDSQGTPRGDRSAATPSSRRGSRGRGSMATQRRSPLADACWFACMDSGAMWEVPRHRSPAAAPSRATASAIWRLRKERLVWVCSPGYSRPPFAFPAPASPWSRSSPAPAPAAWPSLPSAPAAQSRPPDSEEAK